MIRLVAIVLPLLLAACSSDPPADSADTAQSDSADTVSDLADGAVNDAVDPAEDVAAPDTNNTSDLRADPREIEDTDMLPDASDEPDLVEDTAPGPWRSALYPANWAPGFADGEGRFVHDFSYAGYRSGLAEVGSPPERLFDAVADHGADATAESDSTAAIQAAIDAASDAGGGVVYLSAGRYRLDGRLWVRGSNVVLRGAGSDQTELWFTSHDGMSYQSHITFDGQLTYGDDIALVEDGDTLSAVVLVDDATGLNPGDDVVLGWTISPEFVTDHAMDGTWQAFNDTWQPFFWRTVAGIDRISTPHTVTLDVPLRYPALVRDGASLRTVGGTLFEVGAEDFAVANAVGWDEAWANNQVHALEMRGVADSWIHGLASSVSPGAPAEGDGSGDHLQSGGLIIRNAKRLTVSDTVMEGAQHRGGGGNGYLFEVRQSGEVLFVDCAGRGGRHNFIQNWGFGATGIVWLRVESSGGRAFSSQTSDFSFVGLSEFHHSLATANLIDSSVLNDGWGAVNRGAWSSGAGHSATQNVLWNNTGNGEIRTAQYGWGYVIGTAHDLDVLTITLLNDAGTEPEDYTEGIGDGARLEPQSLYEDQLARRLGR